MEYVSWLGNAMNSKTAKRDDCPHEYELTRIFPIQSLAICPWFMLALLAPGQLVRWKRMLRISWSNLTICSITINIGLRRISFLLALLGLWKKQLSSMAHGKHWDLSGIWSILVDMHGPNNPVIVLFNN